MNRYGLKEFRRHGEAASVLDLVAVEEEVKRLHGIVKLYPKRDTLNVDETALFPLSVPNTIIISADFSLTS